MNLAHFHKHILAESVCGWPRSTCKTAQSLQALSEVLKREASWKITLCINAVFGQVQTVEFKPHNQPFKATKGTGEGRGIPYKQFSLVHFIPSLRAHRPDFQCISIYMEMSSRKAILQKPTADVEIPISFLIYPVASANKVSGFYECCFQYCPKQIALKWLRKSCTSGLCTAGDTHSSLHGAYGYRRDWAGTYKSQDLKAVTLFVPVQLSVQKMRSSLLSILSPFSTLCYG